MLEAFRGLRERLVVVGKGPQARALGRLAGPNVQMLAEVDAERLRDLYGNARALVFAGVEDFGIAFAESLACGTPVLAFDRGGVRDIVRDGQDGILFPEATVDGLRAALARVAGLDFDAEAIRCGALRFSAARFREEFARVVVPGGG